MPVDEPLYPVNLLLRGVPTIVVGGGRVATGKVRGLVAAEANVTVVAPDVTDELAHTDGITIHRRSYVRGEAADYRLAFTATGVPTVDGAVFEDAQAAGIWINAADDPAHCSFTLPSLIRRGPLLVTFATGGNSPALASWLRERSTRSSAGSILKFMVGLRSWGSMGSSSRPMVRRVNAPLPGPCGSPQMRSVTGSSRPSRRISNGPMNVWRRPKCGPPISV
jgi:siroheme synthase-like protein